MVGRGGGEFLDVFRGKLRWRGLDLYFGLRNLRNYGKSRTFFLLEVIILN